MKRWIKRKGCLFLAAILLLFLGGCGADKAPSAVLPAEEPLTIWLASDLHYLSPKLTDNGIRFQNRMLASDGKLTEHSAEIVERFLQLAAEQKPDALILSGDLTYDGEKQSLRELAKLLKKVQDAGVSVLVIPGNHDIAYPFARKYSGESSELVDNIPQEDFIKLCSAFGYRSALSADEASFSYLYPLAEDFSVLMLDANSESASGLIQDETMQWAEKQLELAQQQGQTVISVTHQNVLAKNEGAYSDFILDNAQQVEELLQKYGVKTNFSGHSHIFHRTQSKELTDVVAGSLTASPLQYYIVEVDEKREVSYHTGQVDVFREEAAQRFADCTRLRALEMLYELDLDAQIQEKMADFAAQMNQAYYAGEHLEAEDWMSREGWTLWQQYGKNTKWKNYFEKMLQEQ